MSAFNQPTVGPSITAFTERLDDRPASLLTLSPMTRHMVPSARNTSRTSRNTATKVLDIEPIVRLEAVAAADPPLRAPAVPAIGIAAQICGGVP
jgi:hypothetical protein